MSRKPIMVRPRGIGPSSLRMGPYYTVASVELGNTTTKCIIVTTNLETAEIFEIDKEVRMTRDVRPPMKDETVFGRTLMGIELTQESVTELVSDILRTVLARARLDIERDLHFVVRSTGVTAGFAKPEEVGTIVKALAAGCLHAGVAPRKMTASLSPENLPPSLRNFTWLHKVYFDGAVASSLPPSNAEVVANEMEGELITAGLKGAAKSTDVDFRNPVMTLDFGTTLAGRITDKGHPYAKTIGSFAGLAGAIPDALVRGTGEVDEKTGSLIDLRNSARPRQAEVNESWIDDVHRNIRVERIAKGTSRFGTVPVNVRAAEESEVTLMGVDAGENGSALMELERIGRSIVEESTLNALLALVDKVQVRVVQRLLDLALSEGLVLEDTSLGLTGRAVTTGNKPKLINSQLLLENSTRWSESHQLLIVEDGLAMGAAVAARCMNSMGTIHNPMGGTKGAKCVMGARMKLQRPRDTEP
ncbi:MAG: methanogenesis marker 14 protein [Candidatus Thorarchaeota archaeon]